MVKLLLREEEGIRQTNRERERGIRVWRKVFCIWDASSCLNWKKCDLWSRSIYRLKEKKKMFIPLSRTQMKILRHSIFLSSLDLNLSVCPLWKKACWRDGNVAWWKCWVFFRSRSGLFGMDLGFIVGLSFVRKLMPLCPLAHKSPDFFFLSCCTSLWTSELNHSK